jgi:hypothetical protein
VCKIAEGKHFLRAAGLRRGGGVQTFGKTTAGSCLIIRAPNGMSRGISGLPVQREYGERKDDELLQVASDRQSLTDNAKSALDAEIRNRNLTAADLAKHQNFVKRSATRHGRRNRILFGSRRNLLAWVQFGLWARMLGIF